MNLRKFVEIQIGDTVHFKDSVFPIAYTVELIDMETQICIIQSHYDTQVSYIVDIDTLEKVEI